MKLEPIGQLFAASWRRFQHRLSVVTQIFLVPIVLIVISRMLFAKQMVGALALGGFINVLAGIVSVAASVALIMAFGKGTDFAESYRHGFKLFWPAIWIALLAALAVVGGLVLLIVPGVMLVIQLALASYLLVLEGKRGIGALAGSREYMKGYWWAFLGRNILLGLVFCAGALIIYLPAMIIFGKIVGAIVYGALLLFFVPFSVAYHYEIFENLRRLKPDALANAAKAEGGFLKTSVVIGAIGIVAFIVLVVIAAALFGTAAIIKLRGHLNNNSFQQSQTYYQ